MKEFRGATGRGEKADNAQWSAFWAPKLLRMSRQGVVTFKRPLRYRNQVVNLPTGGQHALLAAEEKGIDVRIAIDVIRMAHQNTYDVALVFSQDQDLSEVASEVRLIAREQDRWVKMVSAFPTSPTATNKRGLIRPTGIGHSCAATSVAASGLIRAIARPAASSAHCKS